MSEQIDRTMDAIATDTDAIATDTAVTDEIDRKTMGFVTDDAIEGMFDMDETEEQRASYRTFIDQVAWMQEHGTVPASMDISNEDPKQVEHEAFLVQKHKPLDFQRCLKRAFFSFLNKRVDRIGLIRFCCERGAVPILDQILTLIADPCGNHIENLVPIISYCQERGIDVHTSDDILMSFAQLHPNSDLVEYLTSQGCVVRQDYNKRVNEYITERLLQ